MSFRLAIRKKAKDFASEIRHIRERLHERKKFWDPRRREIYGGVSLTSEQKRAIDKLYLENYGEKIPYIWHRHLTAFTGQFDVNYFPELLYIPEFERFENLWEEYTSVFADKNVLPMLAAQAGIAMPKTIVSCTKGMFRDGEYRCLSEAEALERLKNAGEVFCKPAVDTSSGIETNGKKDITKMSAFLKAVRSAVMLIG